MNAEKITEFSFKEKYLEYESKITLEIFTLVWNRLIELGYKSFNGATIETRYYEFNGRYRYFRTTQDHPNEFTCYNNGNTYTKTTVEEILGYNPFIKETKPSKDWSKATEEELLGEAKRRYPIGCKVKLIGLNVGSDFGNEVRFTKHSFYRYGERKELYIDGNLLLFNRDVWAEIESLPEVEVIPEYVELLPGFDTPRTGEIFDTKQPIPDYPIWTKSWTWEYLLTAENHKHYFKPSTKEAFDAQNKDEEKFQFIVGKWYKCKGYDYIIKYFGITKSKTGDAILYSDLINCDKSYKSYPEGETGVGYTTNKYWYELTDLSEIQQYLPDGHIDKIVKPVDKQVSKEPTRLSFYVKYCDEFTEDLLKSLLEWSQKNNTLKDRGRDNSFKGLKRDGYFVFDNFGLCASKSCLYKDRRSYGYGVDNNTQGCFNEYSIKQVKELIGYKEQKTIEKWNVGSYVVAINNGNARGKPQDKYQIGFINKITHRFHDNTVGLEFSSNCCNKSDFKWFATKSEAEEFAKTLVEPDSTIECETCNGTGEVMIGKLYPNGHTEVNEECTICGGSGIIDKPEQPLKQAVHCKTQEEWDFFILKEVSKSHTMPTFQEDSAITFNNSWDRVEYLKNNDYQILSFQEWCDLNGYKMKKEVKFEVGEWYKVVYKNPKQEYYLKYINNRHEFGYSEYIVIPGGKHSLLHSGNDLDIMSIPIKVSIEEIQQYLPEGHPDKISSTKDTNILNESSIGKFISFRYNNRFYNKALIVKENGNIYLLNNCHSNNDSHKDKSVYKYSLKYCNFYEVKTLCKEIKFLTTEEVPKPKMILSIDDEELPMVNIIKTNPIKQLLDND